jgi:hypothetical protein
MPASELVSEQLMCWDRAYLPGKEAAALWALPGKAALHDKPAALACRAPPLYDLHP